eukprot:1660702-Prorocentrum_lima.AAC.1
MEIRRKSLTALSSCEAELVGMVAGVCHGIDLFPSLGEWTQAARRTRVLNDNSAAITLARAGPNAACKTRH